MIEEEKEQDQEEEIKSKPQSDPRPKIPLSLNEKLIRLTILVGCFAIVLVIYTILQPQNLSDIDGYKSSTSSSRNLHEVLSKALEGNYSVTLTEAEINQMLQNELVVKQGGMLASDASIKRVLVRLKKDLAEVIILREVFGHEITVSMYIQLKQSKDEKGIATDIYLHGGDINDSSVMPKIGGRFGKLSIPQGFLRAVFSDYTKIADTLAPEIDLGLKRMSKFEIQNKRVILDPSSSNEDADGGDSPF